MSSELRVNKLTSRSGVGTVTFNDSGVIITGIATAATLDITGNATIAGVLSYDDVTNVDSVGIVTAAGGVDTNTIRGKTNNSNIAIGARASNGTFVHALTITPGRDVGVGDAAPDSNYGSNLSVHSTATDGARLKLSDGSTGKTNTDGLDIISTGSVAYFINRENADMVFYTNNTERLRIDSCGNVGIDFIPKSLHANVTSSLNVGSSSLFQRTKNSYVSSNFYYNSSDVGKSIRIASNGYAPVYQQDVTNGAHVWFKTNNASAADETISLSEAMRITKSWILEMSALEIMIQAHYYMYQVVIMVQSVLVEITQDLQV